MLSFEERLWASAFSKHGWQMIGMYGIGNISTRQYWFTFICPQGTRHTVAVNFLSVSIGKRSLLPHCTDVEFTSVKQNQRYFFKKGKTSIPKLVEKMISVQERR